MACSRRTKQYVTLALSLVLVLLLTLGLSCKAAPEVYRIKYATTSTRSGFYAFNVAKAEAVHKVYPEIEVTVVETGGTVDNLELLRGGEVEWAAHTNMPVGASAYYGMLDYEGRAFPELRQLWNVIFFSMTLFATEESGITSITELTGKKFGRRSGAADGLTIESLFDALGIKPDWMRAKAGALVDATKARSIVGWGKMGAPESSIMECAAALPITVLAITPEQVAEANKVFPGMFIPAVVPAGTYPGQDQDVPSIGMTIGDGCRQDMPEELAYKLIKAVFAECDTIAASYGANTAAWASENKPWEKSAELSVTPLHPGAIKYYKEMGVFVPEDLIPPEMK